MCAAAHIMLTGVEEETAMSIQEWAFRKDQHEHQRRVGEIAMLKGGAERTRLEAKPSRVLMQRDLQKLV
jgi:hypothetical protein